MKKILGIILLVVVLFIAYEVVDTGLFYKKTKPFIDNSVKVSELHSIESALVLYSDNHDSKFPASLEEIKKDVTPVIPDQNWPNFLYAYSPDYKTYHIGVKLNDDGSSSLKANLEKDKDFNSKTAGYINGFDGEDPIFDLAY